MPTRVHGTVFSIAQLLSGAANMPKPRYQEPTLRQNKNGTWFFRVLVDVIDKDGKLARKKKTVVVGPASIGKREANRLKNDAMKTINRSDYIIQSQITLESFIGHYRRAHVAQLASSTQCKYEAHLKNHILPEFGPLMLCEITTLRVQTWLDQRQMASATRTDIRNILSSIFKKASDWGHWQERNPIQAVSPGRARPAREQRKLTDEQTRRLLACLPIDVRLMCCTGLFCTLRVSEMLGLQEKHLDFLNGQIQIRQRYYRGNVDVPKNPKASREVPMGYLAEDLKRAVKGEPDRFVFQIQTKPKWGRETGICRDDRDLLQHFLRPAAVDLGFYWKGFGWHSLRREAVTGMGSVLGIGLMNVMAGHSTAAMNIHYTLSDKEKMDRASREFHERILGKPEGSTQ